MRFIRLLGAVVIFYGLSYFFHALLQILSLMRYGIPALVHPFVIINITIGIVGLVNGLGLLLVQRWSRVAWLISVTALLMFHNLVLLLTYLTGGDLTNQMLNVIMILFLAVITWAKLGDDAGKKYFVKGVSV